MFARIPDASCTRCRCVSHAFRTRLKKNGVEVNESLVAALLRGFVLARMHLMHLPDLCSGCVLHEFQMHINVTLELSCTIPEFSLLKKRLTIWEVHKNMLDFCSSLFSVYLASIKYTIITLLL